MEISLFALNFYLKYINHSKKFWNIIENYMPDYKLAKKN